MGDATQVFGILLFLAFVFGAGFCSGYDRGHCAGRRDEQNQPSGRRARL